MITGLYVLWNNDTDTHIQTQNRSRILNYSNVNSQTVKHLPTMWETQVQSLGWEDPLEKEMATDSSILAWKIPWMEEPGGLQSMGLQRVGHDWVTELNWTECRRCKRRQFYPLVGKIPWRRKWQPTPVFMPGKSHVQGSLTGYSPWGRKESDTTEVS